MFGDHQVGCGINSDRISRYNAIRDVIFSAAQSAALGPTREASGLLPDSASCPPEVLLPHWSGGCPAALDIHVITLSEAAQTQGHALQISVQRKLTSNLPGCHQVGISCVPLVAEALDGLAKDFSDTLKSLRKSISLCFRADRDASNHTPNHPFGKVSIALWRGNAAMLLHRLPTLALLLDRQY